VANADTNLLSVKSKRHNRFIASRIWGSIKQSVGLMCTEITADCSNHQAGREEAGTFVDIKNAGQNIQY
jgi:hypothetical protein